MKHDACRVLFVCYGNLCRSPMAEAMFRSIAQAAGLGDRIEAESAGVGAWCEGGPAHPDTLAVLGERGVDGHGLQVRPVLDSDRERFDWVLAMDRENLRALQERGAWRGHLELFLRFAPDCGRLDVPDPYLHGGFGAVADLIDEGCRELLDAVTRTLPEEEADRG